MYSIESKAFVDSLQNIIIQFPKTINDSNPLVITNDTKGVKMNNVAYTSFMVHPNCFEEMTGKLSFFRCMMIQYIIINHSSYNNITDLRITSLPQLQALYFNSCCCDRVTNLSLSSNNSISIRM